MCKGKKKAAIMDRKGHCVGAIVISGRISGKAWLRRGCLSKDLKAIKGWVLCTYWERAFQAKKSNCKGSQARLCLEQLRGVGATGGEWERSRRWGYTAGREDHVGLCRLWLLSKMEVTGRFWVLGYFSCLCFNRIILASNLRLDWREIKEVSDSVVRGHLY